MTRQHLTPTLTALNREWGALCDEHTTLPARWRLACGREATEAGLAGILGAIGADPDAVLLGLLTLHRGGDRLAGRVVLLAFVGKLVLMAASDPTATLPDYLAAMWERVASYPLGRRRRRVAANLVLDTLKSVKSAGRQQGVELPGWDADTTPSRPRVEEAWGDIEEVLRECQGNVSDAAKRLGVSRGLIYRRLRSAAAAREAAPAA